MPSTSIARRRGSSSSPASPSASPYSPSTSSATPCATGSTRASALKSGAEACGVFLLQRLGLALLRLGIGFHQFDLRERSPAGLQRDIGVEGAHPADIAHELLRLAREEIADEEACRVRVRRPVGERDAAGDQRRALAGIDDLDGIAALLQVDKDIFEAVGLDGTLAHCQLLGRFGSRLHLHDMLLSELLEIGPAEIPAGLERGGDDAAAVARMRLDDLAAPFRIEQVGKALGRVLGLDQARIVGDRHQRETLVGEISLGVALVGRPLCRHFRRHEGFEPTQALPVMNCAVSEESSTSTANMLLARSWAMRCAMRSPPLRSTCTAI